MTEKFQNKYRIPSARLQNWDYGSNGLYFITICTANRINYFGEIVETRLIASLPGKIAQQYWMEIPKHFPFVQLGDFVVMPNHVHGILIIDKNANDVALVNDVETRLIASLPSQSEKTGGFAGNKNPMLNENISRIIRWYKGRCSFEIRKIHADFEWQTRFYDHIIRDEKSYRKISDYIINNPLKWFEDKFFIE